MLLKRLYQTNSGGVRTLAGVSCAHTGTNREQNFSAALVAEGLSLGWMSMAKGQLILHAQEGDLVYQVVRGPGRYCCHCSEKLEDDASGALARQHVAAKHAGATSPDASNPAGYRRVGGYECVLDRETHARTRGTPGQAGTFTKLATDAVKARRAAGAAKRAKQNAIAAVGMAIGLALLLAMGDPTVAVVMAANFVFNIAKGRAAELYNRVDLNDPTNAVLLVIPLETSGLEAQSALEDSDNFSEVVDGTTNEATTNGWNRKTLTDADIVAFAPDDTNNRVDLVIPDQTWTAVSGNAVSALVIAYDSDSTAGTDTNVVPLTHHDFTVTPDGSDITADVPTTGFFRAT